MAKERHKSAEWRKNFRNNQYNVDHRRCVRWGRGNICVNARHLRALPFPVNPTKIFRFGVLTKIRTYGGIVPMRHVGAVQGRNWEAAPSAGAPGAEKSPARHSAGKPNLSQFKANRVILHLAPMPPNPITPSLRPRFPAHFAFCILHSAFIIPPT